jgi:hypothetical protein
VVTGFKDAIHTYALGMIQNGKNPEQAISGAVDDLTQWNHQNIHVNGRTMQVQKSLYKGTPDEFSHAVGDMIDRLDINRINLTDDNHRPIFPVAMIAGHEGPRNEAIRSILQTKVFPNMNPDGHSFSLYVRGQENDFQLRDTAHRPLTMDVSDLPTYTWASGTKTWEGNRQTHWPAGSSSGMPWPMLPKDSGWGVPRDHTDDPRAQDQ